MANGKQLAEQNVTTFETWLASKTEDDFRAMACRGVLSRKEIAKECAFAQSALTQNPRIRAQLKAKEDVLRAQGLLPSRTSLLHDGDSSLPMRKPDELRTAARAEYIRRLENDIAALRAELEEFKRKLERYELLDEALAATGRLLR